MPRTTIGIGVVGQGFIGRAHVHAVNQLRRLEDSGLELRVLCGRDPARAEENARVWGFDRAVTDSRAVVEAADVDVVCVLATNDLHRPIAIAALQAGKSVLCEKPLGRTVEDSRAMLRAAQATQRLSACSFNYRYMPAVELARQMVLEGEVGEVAHFRAQYLQDWGWDAPYAWHHDRDQAGTGAIGDYCHIIDLAHHLVGDIASVHAETLTVAAERADASGALRPVSVEDAYVATGRLVGGALLSLEASRVATGRKARQGFEINGRCGSIWWDMEDLNHLWVHRGPAGARAGFAKILVTEPEHPFLARWWPAGHTLGWEHALVNQWAALERSLVEDRWPVPPQATFADGWRADVVVDALARSADTGRALSIDYDPADVPDLTTTLE
jgi:predicted dehydrogenase